MNRDHPVEQDSAPEGLPHEAAPSAGETVELSAGEYEALKARAEQGEAHQERLLRLTADFDNFKKRSARERQEAIKFANEALLERLVPVLDNFEAATAAVSASEQTEAVKTLLTGVQMIQQQLKNALYEMGLEEIVATEGVFDPTWHEAVSQQETAAVPEGHIVQQLRKGYKLRDRLLRPATVIVARKPAQS